jgi:hypothetical protein
MKYILFTATIFLCGCVSRQLANKAVDVTSDSTSADIRFTYEVKDEFSTEYFGMLGFVIENNTHQWITIDSVEVDAESGEKENMSITGGSDINTWFTSMNKAKQIESINKQRLWGTISFISTLGAVAAKNQETKQVAALGAIGSLTMLNIEQFNAIRRMIDLASYYPEDHLLRTPFRVPPGLGVDKWMVVNTQIAMNEKMVTQMKLKVYLNGGPPKEYVIEFLKNITKGTYAGTVYSGNWQKKVVRKIFSPKKK